jgi:hypothetical protein
MNGQVKHHGFARAKLLLAPAPATAAGTHADPSPTRASGVQQVMVVFKTQFDIGFTDLASNVVQRYRTAMIDQALDATHQLFAQNYRILRSPD